MVTGVASIDLLIEERKSLYNRAYGGAEGAKREERNRTIKACQDLWDRTEDVAQWTKQLIPQIGVRLNWRLDYYLTQIIAGHGCFWTFVKKIGKTECDVCTYCDGADMVAHTLFECERWKPERDQIDGDIRSKMFPENLVDLMIEDRKTWEVLQEFIRKIMKTKETEERHLR